MHSEDEILRASAAWAWFPRGSEQDDAHLQLVRYPERFGGGVRASQVRSSADAASVVDHAIERSREWGATRLTFWTNPSDGPDLEDEFIRRGAVHEDTVTVFARPIPGDPIDVPADAQTEIVRTLDQVRDVDLVNVPVWEQHPLDEAGLREELAEVVAALDAGDGGRVLARLDGRPVSTGGCTVAGGFVRLWGAATLPEYRGRGAYRAVLAERLRVGADLGATTALVKGRVSTSAPILARAGFTQYGDERSYVLAV
ncbi:GNAT family N-acetyltransferase [Microbacterium bovistercoris]|uniref:GNAT family N-acetyltransferase n=1 Tax=Microbacterium bovistercoris TaxID=2293570 RepID=A0A371NS98_9MICO|nr:GNAT family N-acetyltransferase [Microbacterium bovistercoris]REJ04953.1 GNAT family N-acetyltransferase [Microbacterium bovistercoris]